MTEQPETTPADGAGTTAEPAEETPLTGAVTPIPDEPDAEVYDPNELPGLDADGDGLVDDPDEAEGAEGAEDDGDPGEAQDDDPLAPGAS